MLTVKRRPGQAIIIGEGIVVTIIAVRGQYATVNITAPDDVRVDREEVAFRRALGEPPPAHVR
jgi:carbon storage regulator